MKGMIFDIQEFTVHDGLGGRITVFMKGCPLRCMWCHNPEGQSSIQEIMFIEKRCISCHQCETLEGRNPKLCPNGALRLVGYEITSDELVDKIIKLKEILDICQGGVTFSGGEPCYQSEFLIDCLRKCQQAGIHTAIETSGYCEHEIFKEIISYCDMVMMDLKLMDDQKHIQYTGQSNQKILENTKLLMESGKNIIFRTPMIEGITDTEENLKEIQTFIKENKWEKIPSNPLASLKYKQLNREYKLK